jgi:WD40 repeat protein
MHQTTRVPRPIVGVLIGITLVLTFSACTSGSPSAQAAPSIEPPQSSESSPRVTVVPSASSAPAPNERSAWTATGPMVADRAGPTVTLLPDGRVLAAGGYGPIPDATLSSAELFDPGTGSWTEATPMLQDHGNGTATLLLDGTVLVAGAGRAIGSSPFAEVYDPDAGTWTETGSLLIGRSGHTATLLADGRVLVMGGCCDPRAVTSAELYDPATGVWTATGQMIEPRNRYSAVPLADGTVLIAGGQAQVMPFGAVATAELFDPATETWTTTGTMVEGRISPTAVPLPDGRVLLIGGGDTQGIPMASAEIYDPETGSWTPAGTMTEARDFPAAARLDDGRVLVAGGFGGAATQGSAELFDPNSGTSTAVEPMIELRQVSSATLLPDGRVLVLGASSQGSSVPPELYDADAES